ncbi:hypothetical protein [Streptomyces anulatus]|uniref:hypothetical protein n=1 Tax=Streptomyces anulatus TaxID=1892 RepID=UPI001F4408E7|nr:hypothetical protein [Streptomyces anulatus]
MLRAEEAVAGFAGGGFAELVAGECRGGLGEVQRQGQSDVTVQIDELQDDVAGLFR